MEFGGLEKDGGKSHRNVDMRNGGTDRRWNGRALWNGSGDPDKSQFNTRFNPCSAYHPRYRLNFNINSKVFKHTHIVIFQANFELWKV